MATAAVLCIGTEITRGEIASTNAAWIAAELAALGVEVEELAAVPDERAALGAALRRLGAAADLLVVTGGLGPTTDDITAACAAEVLGVPLERDGASLEAITARLARFGRTPSPSNAKQADVPRGARVLPNAHGTAPGFTVRIGRADAFFLPGVPREMEPMFAGAVADAARALATGGLCQVRLRTFGLPEAAVNERLAGLEAAHGVTLGYRAHFPEIEVKVLARAPDPEAARRAARAGADEVRARLGDVVYGEGDRALPAVVGALLGERGLCLGAAESCTGGLFAELVTETAGASVHFRGSIVAYADRAKIDLLGVEPALLAAHGAVSSEVARAMAEGARRALCADLAVAITGIAGPGGATADKPVGLVHCAVAAPSGTFDRRLVFPGTRQQVRLLSAWTALELVRSVLAGAAA